MSEYIDFSNYLFRSSAFGHLATEPKSAADKKEGNLSEGAKTHCMDICIAERTGRQTDICNKYIEKGLMVEEDGLTLSSVVNKKYFIKNEIHFNNDFIKGTPDYFDSPKPQTLNFEEVNGVWRYTGKVPFTVRDIKCSWDIFTFYRTLTKKVNQLYYWQGQCYMYLTGASEFVLDYCLINTPDVFLKDEQRKLFYKMAVISEEDELYKQGCEALELSMTYDDIPNDERIIPITIKRSEEDIARIPLLVNKGREYLFELQDKMRKGKPMPQLLSA
jgi:hypothetical protein